MTSLVCKYTSNTVNAQKTLLKVFMISLVNFIVNTCTLNASNQGQATPK